MLTHHRDFLYTPSEEDLKYYDRLLPRYHPLVELLEIIPWESFLPELECYYDPKRGQPTIPLLIPLKIEFLRYWYNLSDRAVLERVATDVVFRYFVHIAVDVTLSDHTMLTRFRGHLGSEGYKKVFDRLVAIAREAGLVKDRLRLKDASHVVANIAVPRTLALVAQLRERMLECLKHFDCDAARGFRVRCDQEREQSASLAAEQRLEYRVAMVRDILGVLVNVPAPASGAAKRHWQQLQETIELAKKILDDQAHPENGHRMLSLVDPDARRGKHGDWYDGYVVDVSMDADSGLITQIDVLEAGGDEAQSAIRLIREEQQIHGNRVERLSIDGAGFNGPMIRELEDPDGLNVEVFVPSKQVPDEPAQLPNTEFTPSADGQSVTCPAGQQSRYRQRDDTATIHRFARQQCESCPLVSRCAPKLGTGPFGRTVRKSDYEVEHQRVRARAETPEFASIRREHPAIERKLNELLNHHRGRRAKYWGLEKTKIQQFMTATVVNLKQIYRRTTGTMRAEWA